MWDYIFKRKLREVNDMSYYGTEERFWSGRIERPYGKRSCYPYPRPIRCYEPPQRPISCYPYPRPIPCEPQPKSIVNSYSTSGTLNTAYTPQLENGQKGLGWGNTNFNSGYEYKYNPCSGFEKSSSFTHTNMPLYEYEKGKVQQYDFQQGEKYHNVNETTTRKPAPIDPLIVDWDNNNKLDVTGKDKSEQDINRTVTEGTHFEGNARGREQVNSRREEWDTLVNWNNKVDFDLNGDGKQDRTEWLKPGGKDPLLAIDNGTGKIADGRQLFNETGINGEQKKYANGWEKLRDLYDKDKNGVINGDELNGLSLWFDNGNAITEAGELKNLRESGIVGIELPKDASGTGSFLKQKQIGAIDTYSYSSRTRIV